MEISDVLTAIVGIIIASSMTRLSSITFITNFRNKFF